MDFSLNDEQRILLGIIERFIESELRPLENEVERAGHLPGEHAERIFKLSKSMGLYALNMPSELGGGGLNTLDWILAEEQFGRTSDILVRRAFGNAYEILLECEGEQVRRWLAPVVSGERTCSIALTETGAGSDAAGISTRARRKESGWVLSGGKNFISDAHYSDFFVVTAVTRPEDGRDGISAFIVDKSAPGVEVGAEQEMMGLRGTSHAQIYFNDVRLEPECLLGREGEGLKLAYATLGRVRLAQVAARAIGKASRILDLAVEHASCRRQFGRRIGEFQMIQAMLADSAAEIAAARLNLYHAAWLVDQGRQMNEKISMVKLQASEMLCRVADRAVQIFGGSGYEKSLPIERYYRDSRIFRIFDGTSEIHRSVLARGILRGKGELYAWRE